MWAEVGLDCELMSVRTAVGISTLKDKNILGSLCAQEFSIKVGCETFGGGLSSNNTAPKLSRWSSWCANGKQAIADRWVMSRLCQQSKTRHWESLLFKLLPNPQTKSLQHLFHFSFPQPRSEFCYFEEKFIPKSIKESRTFWSEWEGYWLT